MVDHPLDAFDETAEHFALLERFTVILYDKTSMCNTVKKACRELFCQKNLSLENLPPTRDALFQHLLRVAYQGGIWTTSTNSNCQIPSPSQWGWRLENNQWQPVWTTLPKAANACTELINCTCKKECTRSNAAELVFPALNYVDANTRNKMDQRNFCN